MLQALADVDRGQTGALSSLRDVIVAGERLHVSEQIRELFGHRAGCRLHNHYGPTETHVVTALTLAGDPLQWPTLPTIGRPIANTCIYVLDAQLAPVPVGVTGEIYIGGANVSRGYLNRPELTAERFVSDPFSSRPQARLYRTGDLGRWQPGGTIEYLGRNDDQIKVRGFRVELGEIEAQLVRHPQVQAAAVVAIEAAGGKRIVAYVTPRNGDHPAVEALSAHLRSSLPEHMVPSAFVSMESLPLTPSGKLDRRALPKPELAAYALEKYEPPEGQVEQVLSMICRELLQVDRIGRNDHFFRLGGNSMTSLRLLGKIADAFGVYLTASAIFQCPTVRELAQVVEVWSAEKRSSSVSSATLEEGTIAL
jgi:acyl-coenzyme A synthetase/AMP-(fatty) acid ligase/acyl carrier protein